MNIVVCVKQVPNTKEVRINPKTNNIMREGVPSIMNPFDVDAIEEALRICEGNGGTVTALSMGPMQATDVLQEALDMGVDRAILLCDRVFAGSDTLATGYVLASVIRELDADLVFCGYEAVDGATAQVGPVIAENLGWPQLTRVNAIKIENRTVHVSREVRDGFELYHCGLPLVVCVLKGTNTPRKPVASDKKPEIMSAKDFEFDSEKLGIDGSPTRVVSIVTSGKQASGFVFVDGLLPVEERVRLLMNGGITPKKINFTRGTSEALADVIMQNNTIRRHLEGIKEAE